VDYEKGQVPTSSYRNQYILKLWDFCSGELMQTIKVDTKEHDAPSLLPLKHFMDVVVTQIFNCWRSWSNGRPANRADSARLAPMSNSLIRTLINAI